MGKKMGIEKRGGGKSGKSGFAHQGARTKFLVIVCVSLKTTFYKLGFYAPGLPGPYSGQGASSKPSPTKGKRRHRPAPAGPPFDR